MWQLFSENSPYKKKARFAAILWTLLIFILCFLPGNDIPDINIPLADKWAHMVLFGAFSFLWLCASPTKSITYAFILLVITIFVGWLVEYIQGHYIPGRAQDSMDTLADSVGGLLGIILFHLLARIGAK
ncbi:MAG: VanZ family protein [Flavipsychrobacter sp.]